MASKKIKSNNNTKTKTRKKSAVSDKLPGTKQQLGNAGHRITGLHARPVVVPIRRPLHTASGAIDQAALILIDLQLDNGVVGRSYLFAVGAHNLGPIIGLLDAMREMIVGQPSAPFGIERLLRQKYALLGVHNIVLFAMSGIDMALWDANAKSAGLPLARMLGGELDAIAAYNSNGLGIMKPAALAREAKQLVREGFNAVKIRLGRTSAAQDIAAVRAVKRAIGPEVALMSDFNQGLTMNEAIHRGRLLDEEGGLTWIEEPVRADDFAGTARIAAAVDTPIQIGENFMGPEQMAQALAARCCDFVMPDVQRIGGVSGWLRAAAQAEAAGLEMSTHLFPEISVHLMAVTPTRHWLEYVDWATPVLAEPLSVSNGMIQVPDRPGSGISWDEKAVKRFSV
jgi:mandelate racemase